MASCDEAARKLSVAQSGARPVLDFQNNPFVEPFDLKSSADYDAAISAIPDDVFDFPVAEVSRNPRGPTQIASKVNQNYSKQELNQLVPCAHVCKDKKT